jgi:hypothetical protein
LLLTERMYRRRSQTRQVSQLDMNNAGLRISAKQSFVIRSTSGIGALVHCTTNELCYAEVTILIDDYSHLILDCELRFLPIWARPIGASSEAVRREWVQ